MKKQSSSSAEMSSATAGFFKAQARWEWLLIALGVLVFLIGSRYTFYGDGAERLMALQKFADTGHAEPMKYSMIAPLGAYPLYRLGQFVDAVNGGRWWPAGSAQQDAARFPVRFGGRWWPADGSECERTATFQLTARYNALLWLAALAVLGWALQGAVSDVVLRRFILLLLAGTLASNHVRFFHGEIFTVTLVGAGLAVAYLRNGGWAWAALPLGVANMPASLLGLGLVTLNRLWECRRWRYVLLPMLALGMIWVETRWRLGGGQTGYENDHGFKTMLPYSGLPGFSYPMFFGLLGLMFSFGKGLLFFAPGLLLPGWARLGEERTALRACYIQWLIFLGGLILIYAKWWSWYGGWSFGPRFLVFAALPASLALAVYLERPSERFATNVAVLGILALTLWGGICGAVFGLDNLQIAQENNYALEHLTWHVPEFSVLWHPFVEHRPLSWRDWLVIGYAAVLFPVLGGAQIVSAGQCLRRIGSKYADQIRNGPAWRF